MLYFPMVRYRGSGCGRFPFNECDHLDGVLFIDRISRLKRTMYVKKRKKQLLFEEDDEPGSSETAP